MQFQRICQCKSSLHRKSASRFFYGKLNKRTPMCIKDLIEKVPQKLIAVSSPVSCSFKSIEGQLQKVHFSNGYLRLFWSFLVQFFTFLWNLISFFLLFFACPIFLPPLPASRPVILFFFSPFFFCRDLRQPRSSSSKHTKAIFHLSWTLPLLFRPRLATTLVVIIITVVVAVVHHRQSMGGGGELVGKERRAEKWMGVFIMNGLVRRNVLPLLLPLLIFLLLRVRHFQLVSRGWCTSIELIFRITAPALS